MRVIRVPTFFVVFFMGITPAHAGNTIEQEMDKLGLRDHPRACG